MSVYKIYHRQQDNSTIITEDDIVRYKRKKDEWVKEIGFAYQFLAGDLALDNGYELQKTLTKGELFLEFI